MTIHHRQPVTPALADAVWDRLTLTLGVAPNEATSGDWFRATALAVRDRLVGRWHETNRIVQEKGLKQVAYLSMEFLLARELENALMSTGLVDECREALDRHGVSLDELMALEASPALGNGGLGRLAACFLDSAASLGLPCIGYGIRYEYGMFRQEIADGWQVEQPDRWLDQPYPWEILRPERAYRIRFEYRLFGETLPGVQEWQASNSGLMFHAQAPGTMARDQAFPVSLELQLLAVPRPTEEPTGNLCTPGTTVVIEDQRDRMKRELLDQIREGELRKGMVKNIADFGAFVDLGGIDGLLHITDMSWGRINHPSEVVKIDQEIEVKVLSIDKDKEKIALSLKHKTPSPWMNVEERHVRRRLEGDVPRSMRRGRRAGPPRRCDAAAE